jgi:hypothetical protein
MGKSIVLNFNKQPSMRATAFLALLGRSNSFHPDKPFPQIAARQDGVTVDKVHLAQFRSICGIETSDKLPVIFPFALIYPLLQRILAHRASPLSLFQVLNSRMQVLQYREIGSAETLDLYCEIAGHRIREKGLEMDIASVVKIAGVPVWENTQTFYYRGKFGKPDNNYEPPQYQSIPDAPEAARWFLPDGIGKSFSKLSGDGNPLHYRKRYARFFGFRRDFVQPLLILGSSLKYLYPAKNENAVALDVALKAPIYYESNIILKSEQDNDVQRFDIYMEEDPLPCICGKLKFFPANEIPAKQV